MVRTPANSFLVYPSKDSATPLCRLAADNKRNAIKKARAMFRIGKGAFAVPASVQ